MDGKWVVGCVRARPPPRPRRSKIPGDPGFGKFAPWAIQRCHSRLSSFGTKLNSRFLTLAISDFLDFQKSISDPEPVKINPDRCLSSSLEVLFPTMSKKRHFYHHSLITLIRI